MMSPTGRCRRRSPRDTDRGGSGAYLLGLGPWRSEESRTERSCVAQVIAFLAGLLTLFVAQNLGARSSTS